MGRASYSRSSTRSWTRSSNRQVNTRKSFRKVFPHCSDLVVCPIERDKTYHYFERFDLKNKTVETAISKGANGVAMLLTFQKEYNGYFYTSKAVMKILNTEKGGKDRDNLFHEWMAGIAVNKSMCNRFPCFVRTYGAFLEDTGGVPVNGVPLRMLTTAPSIEQACLTAGKQAIMVEYVEGITFSELLKSNLNAGRIDDIPQLLFQVYYALSALGDQFTHNDLHLKNVLVHRPHPSMSLAFEYVMPTGETVRFRCNYVAKIIDYGRCFVERIADEVDEIKTVPACTDSRCTKDTPGDRCGFKYYDKEGSIHFKQANISQDLRMMRSAVEKMKERGLWNGPSVVFEGDYVTPERKESGWPSKIYQVHDALKVLTRQVQNKGHGDVYGTVRVTGTTEWTFEPE